MKLPDAWKEHLRMRDARPSLVDTEVREAEITRARFHKAQKLADVLLARPKEWPDPEHLTDEHWGAMMVVAGIGSVSVATRVLTVGLLRDRAKQRLHADLQAAEDDLRSGLTREAEEVFAEIDSDG